MKYITSDSEEVLTLLMLDGTYLSIIFATLGPFLTFPPPEAVYVVNNHGDHKSPKDRVVGPLPSMAYINGS